MTGKAVEFPAMLDAERSKYVTREIKYEETIKALREQLAQKDAEVENVRKANKQCIEYFNAMQKDLAASQAREQQLRKALVIADNAGDDEWYPYTPEQAKTAIGKAIALPQGTSALEAVIQKAGAVMKERCIGACNADKYQNECDKSIAHDCSLAIRTLSAVTLQDLK